MRSIPPHGTRRPKPAPIDASGRACPRSRRPRGLRAPAPQPAGGHARTSRLTSTSRLALRVFCYLHRGPLPEGRGVAENGRQRNRICAERRGQKAGATSALHSVSAARTLLYWKRISPRLWQLAERVLAFGDRHESEDRLVAAHVADTPVRSKGSHECAKFVKPLLLLLGGWR
jgi:hypothetical protein